MLSVFFAKAPSKQGAKPIGLSGQVRAEGFGCGGLIGVVGGSDNEI